MKPPPIPEDFIHTLPSAKVEDDLRYDLPLLVVAYSLSMLAACTSIAVSAYLIKWAFALGL